MILNIVLTTNLNSLPVYRWLDHQHEAIDGRTWKIVILDAKIVRICQNHKNWTVFSTIYLVLVVKIVCRIIIFRKNLDGDPTKITKMSRKIYFHEVIAEKNVIFTFWTASITSTRQLMAEPEKSWFLMRKSAGSLKITKTEQLFRPFTSCWSWKYGSESLFFGKTSMGTLQKSQKCHEKSICMR